MFKPEPFGTIVQQYCGLPEREYAVVLELNSLHGIRIGPRKKRMRPTNNDNIKTPYYTMTAVASVPRAAVWFFIYNSSTALSDRVSPM